MGRARGDGHRRRADARTAGVARAAATPSPIVLVSDPTVLSAIEGGGGSFGDVLFGRYKPSTRAYADEPMYRDWIESIRADITARQRRDARSGVGMKYVHRLFDGDWLNFPGTRFELVGIVNRIDRRPFRADRCGETRLVYRLAYNIKQGNKTLSSRLPMTINVVFFQPDDRAGCRDAARRWMPPARPGGRSAGQMADRRRSRAPLSRPALSLANLKAVEINLQQVRWPSTIRPDMGGHAEYLLRVFHLDREKKHLRPAPLENTPDVARLKQDPKAAQALLAWLRDPANLPAIDAGTAVIPGVVLDRPLRVGQPPRSGAAGQPAVRAAFRAKLVFGPGARRHPPRPLASGVPAPSGRHDLRGMSPASQRRRLSPARARRPTGRNRSTRCLFPCRPTWTPSWRAAPTTCGVWPTENRSTTPARCRDRDRIAGGYGAHCGLGDPGFADWKCAAGYVCTPGEDEVGTCLPAARFGAGDPCELGTLVSDADPTRDKLKPAGFQSCARGGACFTNHGGFPGGMCALDCDAATPDEACGLIPILKDFNGCVARGIPFDRCILDNADPAAMRACDADHTCRDDFICAKSKSKRGVCIPPYFLFQLRVDGHRL